MTRLTRREMLALLAGAAATAPAMAGAAPRGVIAVVGAGLAGLVAARHLTRAGAQVVVLEGRERIGGPISPTRLGPGPPPDLGGRGIHGSTGNPLTALAVEAGATRFATSYEAALTLDATGNAIDPDTFLPPVERLVAAARRRAEGLDHDVSLAGAITATAQWRAATATLRRRVRYHINATVEQEYGGDWSEVSAWNFDESAEFSGPDTFFPQGFGQITAMLARGLDVRLGARVEDIAREAEELRLTLAGGDSLKAAAAIVTVPLGVLQKGALRFAAPLSDAKRRAIAGLRMGLLNKCWLRFERVAWPDDVDWIEWLGPKDGVWAEWLSLAHTARAPVLLGFNAGAQAREMETLDDRAMAASAHAALKAMFGESFPAPVAAQVTRWAQDPFSFGSYSFNAVGTGPRTRQALAAPEWDGRLLFAGEATAPRHFGTAHGAVMSGVAAASALMR